MQLQIRKIALIVTTLLGAGACAEPTSSAGPSQPTRVDAAAVKFWEVGSSVKWNRRSVALFRARRGNPGRAMAYLSLAQYRAVLAAKAGSQASKHPSLAAAAAGASVAVLVHFYPDDAAALEAELDAQSAETPWPGEKNM